MQKSPCGEPKLIHVQWTLVCCDDMGLYKLGGGGRAGGGAEEGLVQPLGLLTCPNLARLSMLVKLYFRLTDASYTHTRTSVVACRPVRHVR